MATQENDLKMPDDPTAQDAEWKKIQQNTFTRWCNEHLKCVNLYIYSLETDLCDGLKLIALLQVLSHKKIVKYNKKPTFRPQKIENIAIALKFIEDEDIKLVNIDAGDILKGNLKLILGLIWTLILKYQISLPMMDDDGGDEGGEVQKITPKQALMGWVKSKLPPEVPVNNFNKDWCNGIAIAALVEGIAPGLMPTWDDLDPKNGLENAKEAMKLAEDWLGVPQVITPDEITNPNVDELSVMTYVSYFPEAKLKPGAPLKRKMNDASKCSASGPGLQEHGVIVNKPADFSVFSSGSSRGKINVQVFGPGRKAVDCMVQDNHDNSYSCQYIAPKVGVYDVHVRVGGHHIPKSPFRVNVASDLDSSKVFATGPGLEPQGMIVGHPALFEVNASEAGNGELSVIVIDPTGAKKTELKIEECPNSTYKCSYLPLLVGRYVIVIKYGGKEVAKSPYHVNVTPAADRVKIYGPGLEPGLKTGKPATFIIDCSEAGEGGLDVNIEGPGKGDVTSELQDNGDGTFTCTYRPTKAGTYTIRVKFDNGVVPKCPVKVVVGSTADPSKIKAWGPGLERGVAGRPAEFYVSCKGAPIANLTVGVEGPGQAKVDIKETADGTANVYYYPTVPGKYIIHIMYDEIDIKDSPYTAVISPRGDISKVYADGPGLKDGNMAGKPAEFTVHTKGSGVKGGSVQVFCTDESGAEVDVKVKDNDDGTFTVVYFPKAPGKYTIKIQFMDEDIPHTPIFVNIIPFCDPTKVKATGPGLEGGKCRKPCKFKIDASKAGEGGIGLTIEGPTEAEIKCDDHGDGTCSVEYLPHEDGEYKINVLFADQHIPGSPFTAVVFDDFDASKVLADGPGLKLGNRSGKPCPFTVDTRKAGKAKLAIDVTDEAGKPLSVELTEEEPGLFASSYFPEKEGTYKVSITFGGKAIPKSSFLVKVGPASDPSKVKVSGPGIKPTGLKSLEPTYFEVDASEAGEGNIGVDIAPTDNKLPKVKDIEINPGKKPNTYIVTYTLPKHGEFIIKVTFSSAPVPDSPFKILVTPGSDATKCKVHGAGIEEPICGQQSEFTVDCPPEAGEGTLSCTIDSPTGKRIKANVSKNNNGGYDVNWTPKETGRHKLTIKFGDNEVPGSPFYVDVLDKPDPSKVKAYGPGLKNAYVGQPAEFTIETKNAGPGNLGLTIEGPEEAKIDCKDNGDGTCSITYIPSKPGQYDVNITFDGIHIPNSPFKVGAVEPVDASKVKCKGPGVSRGVPASFPAEFTVDATKSGKAPLEVDVTGPGGKVYPCKIKDNGDGTFDCSYLPEKKGRYQVSPKYGGDVVPGAPFNVNGEPSGDASKVKCSGPGLKRPHVGFSSPFEVDATKAGKGKVNVNAKGPNGKEIPVKVVEEKEGIFAVEYTPEELGPHEVEVLFGGEPVRGSPFKVNATPAPALEKVKTPLLEEILEAGPCVQQQFDAPVDCCEVPDFQGAQLSGYVKTPSGKKEKVDVKDNTDGTFILNYTPKETGKYVLDVAYDGIPIPGSPFEFTVTEGGPEKVKVRGKGIKKGVVAVPSRFIVDTKNAGPGDLSVAVEGPSKVDIECIDNHDGTCEVTYVPVEAGEYDVIVKFDNKQVPGSPFHPVIVQDEPAIEVGQPSDLCLSSDDVNSSDAPNLKGLLSAASGKEKPCEVSEGPNNSILASFVPEEPGKNLLNIKKNNKPIKGLPIPVIAREKPVIGKDSCIPLEYPGNDLPKDLAALKGVLRRPNGKEEPCKVEKFHDDVMSVNFVPEEPGKHLIKIFKNNKQIDDSPFVVMVEGSIDQYPKVGKNCDKELHQPEPCKKSDIGKIKGTLRRPNGKEEPVDVKLGVDGAIAVSFVPTEAGEHLISIRKDGKHVPSSPFSVIVVDEPTVPTVGSECDAKFTIPELDLPKDLKLLTGELTHPNGKTEPLTLGVGSDGSLAVNFVPKEPGKHLIGIKKRGKHVKDSPFTIMVEEAKAENPKVGDECTTKLNTPDLDLPHDLKYLNGEIQHPSGKKCPVHLHVAPDDTLSAVFKPEEPGKHLLHVNKNGKPIKGSPFEIMVDDAESCSGPEVGQECSVNLKIPDLTLPRDLKYLEAELTRPCGKKEPLKCGEGPDETLAVDFTPKEPGKHLIDIKKRGKPVKGSPFEVMVGPAKRHKKLSHLGDEEIVSVQEGDVESCAPDNFIDKPTVGSPCDINMDIADVNLPDDLDKLTAKLTRPSGKREPITCGMGEDGSLVLSFVPVEPGKHLINVKKNKIPVKGSPFEIFVEEGPLQSDKGPSVGSPCDVNFDIDGIKLPDDLNKLKAELTRPTGKKENIPCEMADNGALALSWTPQEPGKHLISVTKNHHPVKGSPFEIMVEEAKYSPNTRKKPTKESPCDVNLNIEGIKLPEDLDKLSAELTRPSGKKEPIKCEMAPDESLALNFKPKEVGKHLIAVKKNGRPVKGSPFEIVVESPDDEKPKVGSPCDLNLDIDGIKLPEDLDKLSAELTRPSGKKEPIRCEIAPDGNLALNFTPTEVGKHLLAVKKNGRPVKGSPFEIVVESPGDEKPKVGSPCDLNLEIDDVKLPEDLAKLSAELTRPSGKKEPIKCEMAPDGSLALNFTPTEAGKHLLAVKKNGRPVKGSPFEIVVESPGDEKPKVGSPCDLNLEIDDVKLPEDLAKLSAELTRPSGKKEPIKCEMAPDGSLALNFTPTEAGKHLLAVKKNGRPVKGSPFEIVVESPGDEKPKVGSPCDLNLEIDDVKLPEDLAKLSAELTRPSGKKEPIKCEMAPDGSLALNFTPTEAGKHLLAVKKNGRPVKGSPFEIVVESPGDEKPKVGSPCDLNLEIDDVKLPEDLAKLSAELTRPSGKKEPIKCEMAPDGSLALNFTPTEVGKHLLAVKKNGRPVKGSPFEIVVESPGDEKPKVGSPCDLNLEIDDVKLPEDLAKLSAELTRPSGKKEPVKCEMAPDGSLALNFTPTEVGKHLLAVKKNGRPVKGSPFEIVVESPGDEKPKVGSPCDLNLDIDGVKLPEDLDKLSAELTRPCGKKEPVKCEMAPDGNLALNFTPTEAGKHLLAVKKNGRPVKGSPFEIVVESPGDEKPKVGSPCDLNLEIDDVKLPEDLAKLSAELTRPCGKKEPIKCEMAPDGSLALNFTPTEAGKHLLAVKKNGRPVKGSPFEIVVESPGDEKPKVGSPCDLNLEIDDVKLPEDLAKLSAELTRPSGKKEPVKCEMAPDGSLALNFTPTEVGKHLLAVKKNGRPVKGSPFEVVVESPGDKPATVGSKCDVNLDIDGVRLPADLKSLSAELTRPSGKKEPVVCSVAPDDSLALSFVPHEPGRHFLSVNKHGNPVKGSPFEVIVEDVSRPTQPTVGHKCDVDFDIPDINLPHDLPNLTAKLTRPNGVQEPIHCSCSPDNTLALEFTPKEPGKHVIDVFKHGHPVKGSPFEVLVVPDDQTSKAPTVGSECLVNLEIPGISLPKDFRSLVGSLKRPDHRTEEPLELVLNPNNTIGVNFIPEKAGPHEISIKKHGSHVSGSPFIVTVEEPHSVAQEPVVGTPVDLGLDMVVKPEDLRFLRGSLTRPNNQEEPLDLKLDSHNHVIVNFLPREPGLHKVNIKRNGNHVDGSPIEVMVGAGKKKPTCDVGFEIPGIRLPEDLKHLRGSVVAPNGSEEPLNLQAGPNNTIVISFLPKESGLHYIHIKMHNKHVGDSPYEVLVKPEDIAFAKPDASKVKCTGKGLRNGHPKVKATFNVDTRDAGYGGLGLSIEGPSKVEINCVDNDDGTCSVDYTPAEPGVYMINVTYAEVHVPGSPFKCRIGDGHPVDEEIKVIHSDDVHSTPDDMFSDMLAFPSSKARSPQDFVIKFSGTGDLKATVTRPSGTEDDAEVIETATDTYTVRFVPRETGEHLVNVKSRRRHIPGSPFKVLVEAPSGGAPACKAHGPGLEGGIAGQPCKFTVITRDAGPGGLAVAVEGPAKAEIQCNDNGDGSCDITWYPVETGEYTVHIRFADEAIPGSPSKVFVLPANQGKAMPMESFKDQVLRVGQQASFAVQMKGKKGKISASVKSPLGVQIDCNVAELEEGNYAVRFVPRELGDHLVSVYLDGQHIPGSPFTVRVGGLEGDPSKVTAHGQGLKGGVASKPAEFTVNALDAGSGALALSIDGPAKVKMNCVEQDDGTYKVIYNPTVCGMYEISIRFAGQHIPNSPYKVRIVESEDEIDAILGDASKCTSNGSGLRHASVGKAATFTVNASSAGRGSIMVGVEGPVIPAKEIVVIHTGSNIYSVNYILEEEGDYILKVLWADKHIPGSPFHVTV